MRKKIKYDDRTEWRLNGFLHREDGPAIEWSDGRKEWYLNGKLHREDGPARERPNGYNEWRLNGLFHREDGPAVEYAGAKYWYLNGFLHREDGPAREYPFGEKYCHICDYCLTYIKLYLNAKFDNCIGQFLYKKDKEYLILCFRRDTHYFYTVFWKEDYVDGRRYDCSLEELRSLL